MRWIECFFWPGQTVEINFLYYFLRKKKIEIWNKKRALTGSSSTEASIAMSRWTSDFFHPYKFLEHLMRPSSKGKIKLIFHLRYVLKFKKMKQLRQSHFSVACDKKAILKTILLSNCFLLSVFQRLKSHTPTYLDN